MTNLLSRGQAGKRRNDSRRGIMPPMRDLFSLTDEQRRMRDLVRTLARARIAPRTAEVDETEAYPADQPRLLGEQGLMGLSTTEALGGPATGALPFRLAVHELACACP